MSPGVLVSGAAVTGVPVAFDPTALVVVPEDEELVPPHELIARAPHASKPDVTDPENRAGKCPERFGEGVRSCGTLLVGRRRIRRG
jgi:hypothetical protein